MTKTKPALLDPVYLDNIRHALGCDELGRGEYRNYFVTRPDSADGRIITAMVAAGLMDDYGPQGELTGGDNLYRVTSAGKRMFYSSIEANTVPLTKSQKRYADYLESDSGLTFIEWLRLRRRVV